MMRSSTARIARLAMLLLCLAPTRLAAQACIGAPMPEGELALGLGAGRTKGLKDYGAGIQANLKGPISLLAAYRFGELDETSSPLHNFVGAISYDLVPATAAWSLCPRVSATHSRFNGTRSNVETNTNTTVFGIGLALGRTFPAGRTITVGPFLMPEVLFARTRGTASAFGHTMSLDDNETEKQLTAGVTLDVQRFMFTVNAAFNSLANSHPYYTAGLGIQL